MDPESVDAGDVPFGTLRGNQGWIDLEHDVVERGPKVRAVDGGMPRRFGVVHVLAARAVQLHRLLIRYIGLAHGEQRV